MHIVKIYRSLMLSLLHELYRVLTLKVKFIVRTISTGSNRTLSLYERTFMLSWATILMI